MKKTSMKKTMMISMAIMMIAGFGTWAAAQQNQSGPAEGCPYQKMMRGQASNLPPETVAKLDEERQSFWAETQELRDALGAKKDELAAEFAKEDMNVETLKALQADMSNLMAQLAQKRVDHMVRMKAIDPNFEPRFKGGKMGGCMMGGCMGEEGCMGQKGKGMKHGQGHGMGKGKSQTM